MSYDFASLSGLDFEELVRDLLQAKWQIQFEKFKVGPDQGIDLRCMRLRGNIIVQCKHYSGSDFSTLLSKIRKQELPKITKLNPDRYILVTSLGLSPENKQALIETCKPYILEPGDIVGRDELNGMLRDFPNIEQSNFKLWLSSKAVLDRVLHNATIVQTELEVQKISRLIPLYVQNQSYPKSMKILDEHRFVLISGIPGIGKTTLAGMLMFSYLERGFRPVVLRTRAEEAFAVYSPTVPTVFYFDDFLGETYVREGRPTNDDAAIADLVDLTRRSPNVRLIMTTREYILRKAFQTSERLNQSGTLDAKYVLQLEDYTPHTKARILYNHLSFSSLPSEYIDDILVNQTYLRIIAHKNYTPRIIEWMTDPRHIRGITHKDYSYFFLQNLGNPEKLWEFAYSTHIGAAARNLLLVLLSFGGKATRDKLREAFGAYHIALSEKYRASTSQDDFITALKELDGSFVSIEKHSIQFHNPSIKDYLQLNLHDVEETSTELVRNAVSFTQLQNLFQTTDGRFSLAFTDKPDRKMDRKLAVEFLNSAKRLVDEPVFTWTERKGGRSGTQTGITFAERSVILRRLYSRTKDTACLDLIEYLILKAAGSNFDEEPVGDWCSIYTSIKKLPESAVKSRVLNTMKNAIVGGASEIIHFECFVQLTELAKDEVLSKDETENIQKGLVIFVRDFLWQEIGNIRDSQELTDYKDIFMEVAEYWGMDFSFKVSSLDDAIEERLAAEDGRADSDYGAWKDSRAQPHYEEESITSMFDSLKG